MEIRISNNWLKALVRLRDKIGEKSISVFSAALSASVIAYAYFNDMIVRYGDSESHLNIAKRVVDSVTSGFAQLGGIWLPLPHLLMLPFVWSDFMWRSGLAGSIVSGIAFVIASAYIYKTIKLVIGSQNAALVGVAVFILNPNVLYLQATPMTELVLICFFVLSTYFLIKYILVGQSLSSLLAAAFFGFCAVLSRYDGWFLVVIEAGVIALYYLTQRGNIPWRPAEIREFIRSDRFKKAEGTLVIFCTLAFFGIGIWLVWDYLILGDPLYFTHSQFSAASQQQEWLSRDRLPAYHNPLLAFLYYSVTAMSNSGILIFFPAAIGLAYFLGDTKRTHRWLVGLLLAVPFLFNVLTLFMGQSVIFIPHLTPPNWEHVLFNVRYGVMSIPLIAFAFGYLYHSSRNFGRIILLGLIFMQLAMYGVGYSKVISYEDGAVGLSSAKRPDAEGWIRQNYDYGKVLMDDYARTISVVRSGIPMEQTIYIGNKPYWEESLVEPEKYARWIVMQENDAVWNELWDNPAKQARLYKYFEKTYTSPQILIFRRQDILVEDQKQRFWNFQCVDTMKYSRDMAREYAARPDLVAFIDSEMSLAKGMGATCVSIGTPYDDEFLPYLKAWVDGARRANLSVWFRGNMSGWEGWFDYPKFTGSDQHHSGIRRMVLQNRDLFREGDMFTPAPEPENGYIGDPRRSEANKQLFFDFLPKSHENCVNAFNEIKVPVSCGYFSVNGDIAKGIITKDLLVRSGDVLVIDHYVREPGQLAEDIALLHKKFGSSIVLGEFGGPIPDIHGPMDEQQQAEYLDKVMEALYQEQDMVLGMNYWVLRGGSTGLVNETTNQPNAAYEAMHRFFSPGVAKGTVTDEFGHPVPGVTVVSEKYDVAATTNTLGEYSMVLPAKGVSLKIQSDEWVADGDRQLTLEPAKHSVGNFTVTPRDHDLWYRIRAWWYRLRD